jgi:glycosyltransferase involved in cell wall biosynthesis
LNQDKSRPELIFWFDQPPKVSKGAFNYISKAWGNKVFYICDHDFDDTRKSVNWNDGDFGGAEVIILSEHQNPENFIDEIFIKYKDAVHVISGFTNSIQKRIRRYIFNANIKLVAFSERPDMFGGKAEKLLRTININIKYRRLYKEFNDYVNIFLPLGQKSVEKFATFGWDKSKMFPFMYNPEIIKNDDETFLPKISGEIKFLYVGRFFYKTKGIDTLMKATKLLPEEGWRLDLVGGYGKDADKVIRWAESVKNVKYIGRWQSQDVGKNMRVYDVIVVPSKYDGWNLLPNEAIAANIGTITTNQAVSDEIITASGAGIVVPADDNKLLATAMQKAISDPVIINEWKQKAKEYAPLVSSETVGNYFIDILDYAFFDKSRPRPVCPWISTETGENYD